MNKRLTCLNMLQKRCWGKIDECKLECVELGKPGSALGDSFLEALGKFCRQSTRYATVVCRVSCTGLIDYGYC